MEQLQNEPDRESGPKLATLMVSKGFKAAGYQFVVIDEGWDKGRGADGQFIVDAEKFPSGLKAVADLIHGQGLKAGIYTELGNGRPSFIGSQGF